MASYGGESIVESLISLSIKHTENNQTIMINEPISRCGSHDALQLFLGAKISSTRSD